MPKVDDAELMNLAEKATPNGAAPIGYGYDPATVTNDSPLARQVPEGTPGAVEGPVQGPFDNPIMSGVSPQSQAAASESRLELPELTATPSTPAAAPTQAPAPGSPPDAVPQAVDAENPVNPATSQTYQQPPFQAPKLRTGQPSLQRSTDAVDDATKAGFDSASAQRDVGVEKGKEREADARILDQQARQQDQQAQETAKITEAHQIGREKAQQARDKAEEDYGGQQIHSYFQDKSVGSRILAGIFVGLGGGMGENHALQRQTALIDQDFQRQKEMLHKKENLVKFRGEDQDSIEKGYTSQMNELKLKQASALEATATAAKAQALRNGASVEQAENNVLVKGLVQKAMELRSKTMEDIYKDQSQIALAGANLAVKKDNAADKRQDAIDARTIDLPNGNKMVLATPKAVDHWTKDNATMNEAKQKISEYRAFIEQHGSDLVWTPDTRAEYKALRASAIGANASVTLMGQSDHSTHLEAQALGPELDFKTPLQAGAGAVLKALDKKQEELDRRPESLIKYYKHMTDAAYPQDKADGGSAAKPAAGKSEAPKANKATPYKPGDIVEHGGKKYKIGPDGINGTEVK